MLKFSCLYKINQSDDSAFKARASIFNRLVKYRRLTMFLAIIVMILCIVLTFVFNTKLSNETKTFAIVTATLFTIVSILLVFWLFKLLNLVN